jgi:hypothetical protein
VRNYWASSDHALILPLGATATSGYNFPIFTGCDFPVLARHLRLLMMASYASARAAMPTFGTLVIFDIIVIPWENNAVLRDAGQALLPQ